MATQNINVSRNDDDPNPNTVFGAISSIAESLGSILQPYKEQELALRGAISADPSLAQKLADLEAKNPGTMKRIAGPRAGAYFASLRPSPEAEAEIGTREMRKKQIATPEVQEYIADQQLTGQPSSTPGAIAQSTLNKKINEMTGKRLDESETLRQGATSKKATGTAAFGKQEREFAMAQSYQALPLVYQLQADGTLQTEFQKHMNGEQSKLSGPALNAALDLPIGETLLMPWLEAQKNARAKDILATRWSIADSRFEQSMDGYIAQAALLMKRSTKSDAMVGDFVQLFGGSKELIAHMGGTSGPNGPMLAQQSIDDNADLRFRSRDAVIKISSEIEKYRNAETDAERQIILDGINTLALDVVPPRQYGIDDSGDIMQITNDATATRRGKTRTPTSVNPPKSAETSRRGSASGGGRRITGAVIENKDTARTQGEVNKGAPSGKPQTEQYSAQVEKFRREAAPTMTTAELYKSKIFQGLTTKEQTYVLQRAKDAGKTYILKESK